MPSAQQSAMPVIGFIILEARAELATYVIGQKRNS
jgi:hypothetical protein